VAVALGKATVVYLVTRKMRPFLSPHPQYMAAVAEVRLFDRYPQQHPLELIEMPLWLDARLIERYRSFGY
jgi:hypothetical protein